MNLEPATPDAVRALVLPDILLARIRAAVARLTLTTFPTIEGVNVRARRIVQEPLLSQLREAVRPSQSGRLQGAATGAPAPLSVSAFDLLNDVEATIAGWFESATDQPATATVEQMLAEWFETLARAHDAGELNTAILENYARQVVGLRYRIQEYFDPPRMSELPVCPACAYTHHLFQLDEQTLQRRCVQIRVFEGGAVVAACRHCGAQWEGGITAEGAWGQIADLQKGVADLAAEMIGDPDDPRPLFRLAPVDEDDQDGHEDDVDDTEPEHDTHNPDALAAGASEEEGMTHDGQAD